jgi:4-hydroxy-3-polyprenylbenzoate decarboxylase
MKLCLQVLDVYLPPQGCSNIGYARIKTVGGGDAKQAFAVTLAGFIRPSRSTAF